MHVLLNVCLYVSPAQCVCLTVIDQAKPSMSLAQDHKDQCLLPCHLTLTYPHPYPPGRLRCHTVLEL